jgi:hypothetical protein
VGPARTPIVTEEEREIKIFQVINYSRQGNESISGGHKFQIQSNEAV